MGMGQQPTASNTFMMFFFPVLNKWMQANWVLFMDTYNYITGALRDVTMVLHTKAFARSTSALSKRHNTRNCI